MTGDIDNQERIDRIARALHAEAVDRIPAHTVARLRPRPEPETVRRGWSVPLGWSLATACAAVFVFALGVRTLVTPDPASSGPVPAVASAPAALDPYEDPLIAFDEDPDLFVWLASDAQPLAME